jgi:hypothetical protein
MREKRGRRRRRDETGEKTEKLGRRKGERYQK